MSKDHRKRETDSQSERLRAILGGSDDRLPRVRVETLRLFHDHLVDHPPEK